MKIKIKHNTTTEKPSTVASCIFRVAGETRCRMVAKKGGKRGKTKEMQGLREMSGGRKWRGQ